MGWPVIHVVFSIRIFSFLFRLNSFLFDLSSVRLGLGGDEGEAVVAVLDPREHLAAGEVAEDARRQLAREFLQFPSLTLCQS